MADQKLRQMLGQQIMDICTGHPSIDTLNAQADALATAVGGIAYFSGMTPQQAVNMLHDLNSQMQDHLICNWGRIARGDH